MASLRRSESSVVVSPREVKAAAPASVARSVRARLAPLGSEAKTVAEVVAVLGGDARLDRVAALAGISWESTGERSDGLAGAEVLRPEDEVGFRHPLLRTAIDEDMPASRRGALHAGAADLLCHQGGVEPAASHLLRAPPRASEMAAGALRSAAARAVRSGAPEAAIPFLRRAVDEPPPDRAALLLELALAEAMVLDPAASEHAGAALEAAESTSQRVRAAVALAQVLAPSGRFDQALELLSSVYDEVGEADAAERLALQSQTSLIGAWKEGTARLDVTRRPATSPTSSPRCRAPARAAGCPCCP